MISEERLLKIILAQHSSEKGSLSTEKNNTVIFRVVLNATKAEVKAAVAKLFNVEVESVRTLISKGKTKRHGARTGRRSNFKKAYVTLAPGADIDFGGTE